MPCQVSNCPVKFEKLDGAIRLQSSGKHDANSHAVKHVQRRLHHDQRAAIENIVRTNPTSSATQARRNLDLQETPVYVSPSKHRAVLRITNQVRESVFAKTTPGVRLDETAGKMTRLRASLFLKALIDEHNRPGGKHLELHDPICLAYQDEKNVTLGCYSTVSCS